MRISVDIRRFAAAVYDVPGQAAWRVRIGGRYLLTSGGVARANGTIDLLEAHAAIVQEHAELADVRLVVTGGRSTAAADADYLVEFVARAEELATAPLVLPPVPDADYPPLLAGASVFGYVPVQDGSGTSALEALAAGVPVVARELPELRAVLFDAVAYGDTVLSIADSLVDVLTDPPEADAGIALAWAYAAEPSEDGVVEQEPDRGDGREE